MNSNSNIFIPETRMTIYAPQNIAGSSCPPSQAPSPSSLMNFQMAQYFMPSFYPPLNQYIPLNIINQYNQYQQFNTEPQPQMAENQNEAREGFNQTQIKIQQVERNNQNKREKRENMVRLFQCQICLKSMTTEKILKAHIQDVHGSKDFECPKCGYQATTSGKILRHACREKDKLHQCQEIGCKASVVNQSKHQYNVHRQSPCGKCHLMFVGYNKLREHLLKNKICHQLSQKMKQKQHKHIKQQEYQKCSENSSENSQENPQQNSQLSSEQDQYRGKPQKLRKSRKAKREAKKLKQKNRVKVQDQLNENVIGEYSIKAPITKRIHKKQRQE